MDAIRHNWTLEEVQRLFETPFISLLQQAQTLHQAHWPSDEVQLCTLQNIKAGRCPEDCKYCSQSIHHHTDLKDKPLDDVQTTLEAARKAKENGATRFCMAAAWRGPTNRQIDTLVQMIKGVRALGLEACLSAGLLTDDKAKRLKEEAHLDYYNHNIDASEDYYPKFVTTRTFQDRLNTLEHVRNAGINVCCGGILGLGEVPEDRLQFLMALANLPVHPESVPINRLVQIAGTALQETTKVDAIDWARVIATARIMMPKSYIRMAAGRDTLSSEGQILAFMAGANSIFYGSDLLTTPNQSIASDNALLEKLGMHAEPPKSLPNKPIVIKEAATCL